jgi:hypothetical protein
MLVRAGLFFLGLVCASIAQAGKFEVLNLHSSNECEQSSGPSVCVTLHFSGEVRLGDTERFQAERQRIENIFKQIAPHLSVRITTVNFDSPGGEIYEAMRLGRVMRENLITTGVNSESNCHSACVIAFLGGVIRLPFGSIGIHSFYSKDLIGAPDFALASERYDEVSAHVEQYLRAVRIPTAFLDEMKKVPHYKMKVLGLDEMSQLGVIGIDPVYAQTRERHN